MMDTIFGQEIDRSRISKDAIIHPGCRILGSKTSIGPGCEIGLEGPVVIENCQLGRNVKLKGGYFSGSVFLDGTSMGGGAHVRSGCILEEEASGAHAVGLKQTIFLPFVAAGSLINFCDALMAGGTDRRNHSEIGSSYVHFNYTPNQDKATASLIGDVPNGVFLDKNPIFLGGQGGLVGPARIAYGTVIAAGAVCREDVLEEDQLIIPAEPPTSSRSFERGVYRRTERLIKNNLSYVGNILALREWYRRVRPLFVCDAFDRAVLDGALNCLGIVLKERIKRMDDLAQNLAVSIAMLKARSGNPEEIERQRRFLAEWPSMRERIESFGFQSPTEWLSLIDIQEDGYIKTIQAMTPAVKDEGRRWLDSIVKSVEQLWR